MSKISLGLIAVSLAGPTGCKKPQQPTDPTAQSASAEGPSVAEAPTSSASEAVPLLSAEAPAEAPVGDLGFDVELKIPEPFVVEKVTATGTTYAPPDKTASLMVSRGLIKNDPAHSLDGRCKELQSPSPLMSVTYKQQGKTWCVISGYFGKNAIYYTKYMVDEERWAQFSMTFDQDQRGTYDPLLGPIQKSFRFVVRKDAQ